MTTLSETENHEARIRQLEAANNALTAILARVLMGLPSGRVILEELADYYIARDMEKGSKDFGLYRLTLKHLDTMQIALTGKPQPERVGA